MKKVVALFLSAIMLLSAVAFAESKSPVPGITVISVDPAESQVIIDNNSEIAKAIIEAIGGVGMTEAFSAVEAIDNPEDYKLLGLAEISFANADNGLVMVLSVPGVKANDEVVVLLGVIVESNVKWASLEVVSVEEGVVTVAVTPEQVASVQGGSAVIAVLTK